MKENLDKCHALISTTEAFNFQIPETVIHNSYSRKLLGVTFDNKLIFDKHTTTISQNANRKLNALAKANPYMGLQKRQILMNAFFNSQLNCCPVTWMFYSRTLNNKINRLYGCCVCIIYNHKTSPFNKLLEKDNSVSTHYRNIEALAIGMYKVANMSSH